jgi:hypothetical protein
MTERTVTIKLGLEDQIGDRLNQIKRQRDALLANTRINIPVQTAGLDQAKRAAVQASVASASAIKDFNALGGAITSKAIAPLAQYQNMLGSVLHAGKAVGPAVVSALRGVSTEFARQRDLAAFWGTSGYMSMGVASLKSSLSGFVSSGGAGFGTWLQNTSAHLAQYRTALVAASAVMVGMAAAAAMSSKHSQNYIQSTLDSKLMSRRLQDKEGAKSWVESAQGTDWSAGRDSRMGTFQTVLSKNKNMGQKAAQKATEDIEKYFFANQEMLQKKGIQSAEQLASEISAPQLMGDQAAKYTDIFGLGFENVSPQARLARVGQEAPDDKELKEAVNARPDVVLSQRLTATTAAMGDAVLPALNSVLGAFLKISDAIGQIPGLGKAMGWGAVLMGAATAGLVVVSMIGSLIPGLMGAYKAFQAVAAGIKLMNLSFSLSPMGIAIIAIVALVAGLYYLEKRFGLVTKAWKAFSESGIGKGVFAAIANGKKAIEDLLGSLTKAYKSGGVMGVLKVALGAILSTSPLFKVIMFIYETLRKILFSSGFLNKLFATGLAMWNKMVDFFSWLLAMIKGGLQWIKDGLGITKREKEAALAKKTPEGWKWDQAGSSGPGWYKNAVKQVESSALKKAREDVANAPPGFFEGIPGIKDLTDAIKALKDSLATKAKDAIIDPVQKVTERINPEGTKAEKSAAKVNNEAGIEWDIQADSYIDTATGSILSDDRQQALKMVGYTPKMARGGSIIGAGSLIGHGGEEVAPADVVVGGETTLEKINRMFQGGSPSSSQSVTIYAPVNLYVDRIDSRFDLEREMSKAGDEFDRKLAFRMRNIQDSTGMRGIGYLRG